MKYKVHKISKSPSFIVFHYYLKGDVNVAHYTTTIALFNVEIKMLLLFCIFFEDAFFKPVKVKDDGHCFSYHVIFSWWCLNNRFPPEKKPETKHLKFEVVNNFKEFISHNDNEMPQKVFNIHEDQEVNEYIKEKRGGGFCDGINWNEQGALSFCWWCLNIFNEHDLQNANHCP